MCGACILCWTVIYYSFFKYWTVLIYWNTDKLLAYISSNLVRKKSVRISICKQIIVFLVQMNSVCFKNGACETGLKIYLCKANNIMYSKGYV